jgi:hypothetical protein
VSTTSTALARPTSLTRPAGSAMLIAGIVAAALALFLVVVPPAVDADLYNYPLTGLGFTIGQILVFLHHIAAAFAVFAIGRAGIAGTGRLARIGTVASTIAFAAFGIMELVAISGADHPLGSDTVETLNSLYAVLSLLLAASIIVLGIAIIRAGVWRGWKRAIVLVVGIWVVVPITPFAASGFILGWQLSLFVWSLLTAAMGVALVQTAVAARKVAVPSAD